MESMRDRGRLTRVKNRFGERWFGVSLAVVAVIAVLAAILGLFRILPSDISSGIASAALTGGLIIVYYRTAKAQQYRYSPYIFIDSYDFSPKLERDNEFYLILNIRNLGDVPARNLRVNINSELLNWNPTKKDLIPAFPKEGSGLGQVNKILKRVDGVGDTDDDGVTTGPDSDYPSNRDDGVKLGSYLPAEGVGRFKVKLDFPVLGGDHGFFSPDHPDPNLAQRPHGLFKAYFYLENETPDEQTGLTADDDLTRFGTMRTSGEYDAQKAPFDRMKLEFTIESEEVESTEPGLTIVLPLDEFESSKTVMRSEDIWRDSMEWSLYKEELEGYAHQFDQEYDPSLDPIDNRRKSGW